jgi:hypothetical protein
MYMYMYMYMFHTSRMQHSYIRTHTHTHTPSPAENGVHSSSVQIEVLGTKCAQTDCSHTVDSEGCVRCFHRESHCMDLVCGEHLHGECVEKSCCVAGE